MAADFAGNYVRAKTVAHFVPLIEQFDVLVDQGRQCSEPHRHLHLREINREDLTRKHKHVFCWNFLLIFIFNTKIRLSNTILIKHHHPKKLWSSKYILPTYILLLVLHHSEEEQAAGGKNNSMGFRVWGSCQHFVTIFVPGGTSLQERWSCKTIIHM